MSPEDQAEIAKLMRDALEHRRGYADFFLWQTDRDIEEWGVVTSLGESLAADGQLFFSNLTSRGRPNDPPDCEALNPNSERLAIEVTELVDGEAIRQFKKAQKERRPFDYAEWTKEKFLNLLQSRISEKDKRFPDLKGARIWEVISSSSTQTRASLAAKLYAAISTGTDFPLPIT